MQKSTFLPFFSRSHVLLCSVSLILAGCSTNGITHLLPRAPVNDAYVKHLTVQYTNMDSIMRFYADGVMQVSGTSTLYYDSLQARRNKIVDDLVFLINDYYDKYELSLYTKGKFVADGEFGPNAVSEQCGGGVLLRRMMERGLV